MKRILVIEDDEFIREMLRDMLEEAGFEVAEAEDGQKGLAYFVDEPVDLVITDILMPNKDGIETIMALQKMDAAVRIIAISGGNRMLPADLLLMAERLGALKTITKPFEQSELLTAVDTVLAT